MRIPSNNKASCGTRRDFATDGEFGEPKEPNQGITEENHEEMPQWHYWGGVLQSKAPTQRKMKIWQKSKLLDTTSHHLPMKLTLVLSYLGCLWLREPVTALDIHRFVNTALKEFNCYNPVHYSFLSLRTGWKCLQYTHRCLDFRLGPTVKKQYQRLHKSTVTKSSLRGRIRLDIRLCFIGLLQPTTY